MFCNRSCRRKNQGIKRSAPTEKMKGRKETRITMGLGERFCVGVGKGPNHVLCVEPLIMDQHLSKGDP